MSEFIYRKASLLAPETHALLGNVLVGIPRSALEGLKGESGHQHQNEDELFLALVTDADHQTVHELLMSPFGGASVRFEAFPIFEAEALPNPVRTTEDGKRFWRLEQRGS